MEELPLSPGTPPSALSPTPPPPLLRSASATSVEFSASGVLLLKKGLARVDKLDHQAELQNSKQQALSLSADESALLVDESGNLRDELGFAIGVSVSSQPPSRRSTANSSQLDGGEVSELATTSREKSVSRRSTTGLASPFLYSMNRSSNKSVSEIQRRAWEDFQQQIGGSVQILTAAELQRWRKNTQPAVFAASGSNPDGLNANANTVQETPLAREAARTKSDGKGVRRKSGVLYWFPALRAASKEREDPQQYSTSSDSPLGRLGRATGFKFMAPTKARAKLLTQLLRSNGVPTELRAQVWMACSGASDKQRQTPEGQQYPALLQKALQDPPESAAQIELDLHRTFPTNYMYQQDEGIASLRHVLLAYSIRNSDVGYCQSMNFIVATLLLHMDESDAFWVLCSIVEDLVPGYFSRDLIGVHVDQRAFVALVAVRFPRVAQHLDALQMPLSVVAYQWFMCLFVNALPLGATLRVWDVFLHEGSKVLFRVALVIIKVLQRDILACTNVQEVYEVLSEGTKDRERFSGTRLLRMAFDPIAFGSFSSRMLAEIRRRQLAFTEKEQRASTLSGGAASATSSSMAVGTSQPSMEPLGVDDDGVAGDSAIRGKDYGEDNASPPREKTPVPPHSSGSLKRDRSKAGLTADSFSWGFSPRARSPSAVQDGAGSTQRPRASTLKMAEGGDGPDSPSRLRAQSFESSLRPGIPDLTAALGSVKTDFNVAEHVEEATEEALKEDDATIWDSDEEEQSNGEDSDAGDSRSVPSSTQQLLPASLGGASSGGEAERIPTVDLPAEFSQRLRSLSFVMGARQTSAALVGSASREHLALVPEEEMLDIHEILKSFDKANMAGDIRMSPLVEHVSSTTFSDNDDELVPAHVDPPVPIGVGAKHATKRVRFLSVLTCGCIAPGPPVGKSLLS